MKNNYENCLKSVLLSEGGYVNDPHDPGGPTNMGITLRTYRKHYGMRKTRYNLKRITFQEVAYIYRISYWNTCKCDILPYGVDLITFDSSVHSGPFKAIKWLQAAVGVKQDGIIGPITMEAIIKTPAARIVRKMLPNRLRFLEKLRGWWRYGIGWRRRINRLESQSLMMIKEYHSSHGIVA